jgi:hypothetical protein
MSRGEDQAMALSDADQELMELQRSALTSGTTPGAPVGDAARDPNAITTWEARRAAQREAYGQYVAAGPIHLGNCLAFTAGMAVPLEHVIRFNLDELEMVNRVATPEMARRGVVFTEESEFQEANPHLARRGRTLPGDLHPSALDPRGGAAELDDLRKAGKAPANAPTVGATSSGAGESLDRNTLAGETAAGLREELPTDPEDGTASETAGPAKTRGRKSPEKEG